MPTQSLTTFRSLQLPFLGAIIAAGALTLAGCSTGSSASSSGSSQSTANELVGAGLSAQQQGLYDEAQSDYQQAISKDKKNYYAEFDLGTIYQHDNDVSSAQGAYNAALAINPKFQQALYNLAVLDTASNPQEAITLYDKVLALNPNDSSSNFNLGLLLIQTGSTASGHQYISTAIRLDPSLASRLPSGIQP